ncbi:MAG: 4Fe-4S binding protein [Chitinispirillaceae bacterium]|nr:4Fe-4S binding protein [Chitinispirillaceae bacterium]
MNRSSSHHRKIYPALASFFLVICIGAIPQIIMDDPVPLLAERFRPGAGWLELLVLALYTAWLTVKLLSTPRSDRIRRNVWLAFSCIFFLQAVLGISGVSRFLMSGTLHLPVPAMIIAAPIYRGDFPLFMPVLLFTTIVLAGPAWCSWFCYFGSWDFLAATAGPAAGQPVRHPFLVRIAILSAIIIFALVLRFTGVSPAVAASFGLLFGGAGIGIMAVLSRKRGTMVHCTAFCPVGLLATLIGKINPFRIAIRSECTQCRLCEKSCRYGALSAAWISIHAPGPTCTLCGDCIGACPGNHIIYRCFSFKPRQAHGIFTVIIVVIHTLFIGFGRI